MLAHNASVLGVPFDSVELFRGDPLYAIQLQIVVNDVAATHRAEEERQKREARR